MLEPYLTRFILSFISMSSTSTYFPDANETVKLELGEFLIHPGNLVHAGVNITRGNRYLMVIFTHTE